MSVPGYGSSSKAQDTLSWTHTVAADENLLIVGSGAGQTLTCTGLTFNGIALTKLGEILNSWFGSGMYFLFNPPVGSYAIAAGWVGGDGRSAHGAVSLKMAGIPTIFAQLAQITASTSISVNLTNVQAAHLLFGFVGALGAGTAGNFTPTSGQTEHQEVSISGGGGGDIAMAIGTEAITSTGGTEAVSWSVTTPGNMLALHAIAIPAKPGGGQILILAAERWKGFLRDLRAGLVPPDKLRRRYRELVTI